jgi:hypothetical protein
MDGSPVPWSAGWIHVVNRRSETGAHRGPRNALPPLVEALAHARARAPIEVHAYCILPGHYHLLVRARALPLTLALARAERDAGFDGVALRLVPVTYGRHLAAVSRYIHLNPVDAGLVWTPEDWEPSSFASYLGDPAAPGLASTQAVLGLFGAIGARHRYRSYVRAGLDPCTRDGFGRPRWSSLFGQDSELADRAWRIEPVLASAPSPRADRRRSPPPLGDLAASIARAHGVARWTLRCASRGGPRGAAARAALAHAARVAGGYPLRDVARYMGYAHPASAAAAAERFDRVARALCHTEPSDASHGGRCSCAHGSLHRPSPS